LCPSELFVEQPFSVLVNPMDLENVFCQIDSIVLTFMIAALRSMSDDLSSHVAQEMEATIPLTKPIPS
jgi:hypothetical protein